MEVVKMHKTISIQARVSITSFAELARALQYEGAGIRSKSDILWRAVEQLAWMYNRKHEVEPFASVHEAIEYMDSIGISLHTNPRATKALLQAAADEAYFRETGSLPPNVMMKKDMLKAERDGMLALQQPQKSFLDMTEEERKAAVHRTAAHLQNNGVIPAVTKAISGDNIQARAEAQAQRDREFKAKQADLIKMMSTAGQVKGGESEND
jgi:hypothetical protein